jgi:hypothetical protein
MSLRVRERAREQKKQTTMLFARGEKVKIQRPKQPPHANLPGPTPAEKPPSRPKTWAPLPRQHTHTQRESHADHCRDHNSAFLVFVTRGLLSGDPLLDPVVCVPAEPAPAQALVSHYVALGGTGRGCASESSPRQEVRETPNRKPLGERVCEKGAVGWADRRILIWGSVEVRRKRADGGVS